MKTKRRIIVSAMAAGALVSFEAASQMGKGRGDRGGARAGPSPEKMKERCADPVGPRGTEPGAAMGGALARELPSLKVDLRLAEGQLGAWTAFERNVRELGDMEIARRRRMLALRNADAKPTALAFVASLAEDDRQRAEAMADLERLLRALLNALDERQRALLDARIVLSQTEPLGR